MTAPTPRDRAANALIATLCRPRTTLAAIVGLAVASWGSVWALRKWAA